MDSWDVYFEQQSICSDVKEKYKYDVSDNFETGNTTSCCRLAVQVANNTQVLICSDLCYYSTRLIWDPFLLVPSLVLPSSQGKKVHKAS